MLSVLVYGAIFLMLTGASMLIACVIFVGVHTLELELKIPFQEDDILTLSYGWCFGLALATGILCMLVGLGIIISHMYCPVETSSFFGTDLLEAEDIEEVEKTDADEPPYEETFRPRALTSVVKSPKQTPGTPMRTFTRLGRQLSTGSNKVYSSSPVYRSALRWRTNKRRPRSSNALYPSMVFQKTEPVGAMPSFTETHPAVPDSDPATADHSTIVLYDAVKLGGNRRMSSATPPARPPPPYMRKGVPLQLKGNANSQAGLVSTDGAEPYLPRAAPKYSTAYRDQPHETTRSGAVQPSPTPPPVTSEDSSEAPMELKESQIPVTYARPNKEPATEDVAGISRRPSRPAPSPSMGSTKGAKPTPPPRVVDLQPKPSVKKAMTPPRKSASQASGLHVQDTKI